MLRPVKDLIKRPKSSLLALLGIIYVAIGVANWSTSTEVEATQSGRDTYKAQFELSNGLHVWGALFILVGIVAFCAAAYGKHVYGFFVTTFMSIWWTTMFLVSLCVTGYGRILPQIFLWTMISLFQYCLSSWPEYPWPVEGDLNEK